MSSLLQRLIGKGKTMRTEKSGLEAVGSVLLPQGVANRTQALLRQAGLSESEGLVVWSGHQEGDKFRVKTVTFPDQRPIRTPDGICVVLDGEALYKLNVMLHERGETLLAQVHSHPGTAYHSEMDDGYAVATTIGSLSIVVPDFAIRPFAMSENATYRLTPTGAWLEVPRKVAMAMISVTSDDT